MRRAAVAVAGFTVLAVGLAMIFLPGPAIVVVPAGIAILATEFLWARRWQDKTVAWVRRRRDKLRAKPQAKDRAPEG